MITPMFQLSQDHDFVIISIKAPYAKLGEADVYFNDNDFKFYANPYFLRLNLPGRVVDNEFAKAQYIADEGTFIITMPKATPGEEFDGLDLLTKLLAPRGKPVNAGVPVIEVIGNDSNLESSELDDDEFDWSIPQSVSNENDVSLNLAGEGYGFANQYCGVIAKLQNEFPDLVDVKDPDKKTAADRSRERQQTELEQFSDDHYLADFYEGTEIVKVMQYRPSWIELFKKLQAFDDGNPDNLITFSEEEREIMRKLPNKEYLLDKTTRTKLLFGLVDILCAYAYDVRTTEGEHSVESPWTICKLSSSLSWFESFTSLFSTAVTFIRRSLCYPLYRHWDLSLIVLKDVYHILSLGRKHVLKCLLDIHTLLKDCDSHYVLNDLYITDYCVWIQTVKSKTLTNLAAALIKMKVHKEDVHLDLVELHIAAKLALQDQDEQHNLETNKQSEKDVPSTSRYCIESCVSNPHADELLSVEMKKMTLAEGQIMAASPEPSSIQSISTENQAVLSPCHGYMPIKSSSDDDSSLSDSETDSDSSSDATDSDSTTDSDDYSSSDLDSTDSDDDDSSSDSNESCLLLKKIKSSERMR